MSDFTFTFPTAEKYVFIHENAHLMLMTFARDEAKFLFLIQKQVTESLELVYPGVTYTERVFDEILNIFFIQVTESGQNKRYVLGSTFHVGDRFYGAYYERDVVNPDVVLFRIEGNPPEPVLVVLDEEEFDSVSLEFHQLHNQLLTIQQPK